MDYLKRLNDFYNKWIEGYKEGPLLIVDIDKNKFPENEEHLGEIITRIELAVVWTFLRGGEKRERGEEIKNPINQFDGVSFGKQS